MPRKPTHADAQLTLQLYDLRRESEMRKARNFMILQFNPESAEDVLKLMRSFGSQENAWFRQVIGYWEMAAAMVNLGVLHVDLFYASTGEPYLIYSKIAPYLARVRAEETPTFMQNLEKAVHGSKAGRARLETMKKRLATWAKTRAEAKNS